MRYHKMNDTDVVEFYGRYAKITRGGSQVTIPRGGRNRGERGIPNAVFNLEFPGALLDKQKQLVDITQGFKIPALISCFYQKFSDDATLVPISKLTNDTHGRNRKNLYVTLNPNKVTHVMIAQRRNHDKGQDIDDLAELADAVCLGELVEGEAYCWDYFVFNLGVDYNHVAHTDQHFLSDAKYAGCGQRKERAEILRGYLEKHFGKVDELLAEDEVPNKKPQQQKAKQRPIDQKPESFTFWNYKDEIYRNFAYVIDVEGRLLEPNITDPHVGKHKFTGAEISVDETWKDLPDDCIIISYKRRSLSEPAEFQFHYRKGQVTTAQLERILYIEQKMRNETRELLGKYDMMERLVRHNQVNHWSKQIL